MQFVVVDFELVEGFEVDVVVCPHLLHLLLHLFALQNLVLDSPLHVLRARILLVQIGFLLVDFLFVKDFFFPHHTNLLL